jgi:hypothetical protein
MAFCTRTSASVKELTIAWALALSSSEILSPLASRPVEVSISAPAISEPTDSMIMPTPSRLPPPASS